MLLTLIIFVLILGLLVFVHEFGHFIVARKLGVKAEEFGFGFPPRAIGIQKKANKKWRVIFGNKSAEDFNGGTVYSLNWIPVGGFVKIKGEAGESKSGKDSFAGRPIWQRGSILFAGVLMNVVAAVVILSIGFCIGLPRAIDGEDMSPYAKVRNKQIELMQIFEGSPAALAGLEAGDVINKVNGVQFYSGESFSNYLKRNASFPIQLEIKRNSEILTKELTPVVLTETNELGIGVGYAEIGTVSYSPILAVWHGFLETGFYLKEIVRAFYGIIHNLLLGEKVSVDIAGPVGIAVFTGRVARLGFVYLLQFTALLSVNLAFLNIFPFPALDGGRLFFLIVEWLRKRPVPQKLENLVHNVGFALLMLLVVFVTYRDIAKFGGGFLDRIRHLVQ